MFLVQQNFACIKSRTCKKVRTQRQYITKDEGTSPTVSHEATIITEVIEAEQQRDIMTADTPNAFVKTDVYQSGEKSIINRKGRTSGCSDISKSRNLQQLCCSTERSDCPPFSNVESTLWHESFIISVLQEVP